jgi:hypothetical protein
MVALLLFAGACTDDPAADVAGPSQVPPLSLTSDPVDSLGYGLAIALSDERFRLQLLEDMRDSPFSRHALHVPSYLRGERGASLLAAIAEALGRDAVRYAETLSALPDIGLVLNPMAFRATWRGEADVVVVPVYEGAVSEGRIRAFRPGGAELTMDFYGEATFPALVLGEIGVEFGDDPEAVRSSAPRRAGSTISTNEEIYGLVDREMPGVGSCGGEGPQCADGQATYVAGTETCFGASSGDADYDTVLDSCEAALAYAAAPFLAFDFGERDYSREPYWAATVIPTGRIRIFYALSYHRDVGYDFSGFDAHYGDSEFITVDLTYHGSGVWSVYQLFLSAHYGAAPYSEWVLRTQFPPPVLVKDPARTLGMEVWVARDKHANYKSQSACNAGNYTFDYCGSDVITSYVEAFSNANLGQNQRRLIDCVQSRPYSPNFWWAYVGTECFWSGSRFKGWYDPAVVGGDDSSPYGPNLRDFLPAPYVPPAPTIQVGISGPLYVSSPGYQSFVANATGGNGSFTYSWEWRPNGGTWYSVSSQQTYQTYVAQQDNPGFDLRVTVTSGGDTAADTHHVFVEIGGGGGGCSPCE